MIALLRSGFFEDFDLRGGLIWACLFCAGAALCLLLKKKNARLITACVSLALQGLCELLAFLPTPAAWAGDGYAFLGDVGLIGASFLVPLAAGVVLTALLTIIVRKK